MRPLVIRGQVWGVVRVSPGNPFLIDRTGVPRLATCDPVTKTIRISKAVPPDMFDQVYLHEVAHAIMEESGVSDLLSQLPDGRQQIIAEELLAWFLEHHAIEVIDAVSSSLGRRVCVNGACAGKEWHGDYQPVPE
jgi:hypothetical protein